MPSEQSNKHSKQARNDVIMGSIGTVLPYRRFQRAIRAAEEQDGRLPPRDAVEQLMRIVGERDPIDTSLIRQCFEVGLIGVDKKLRGVMEQIKAHRDADTKLLITGESGTGKEVVAKCLHMLGDRRCKPLVSINCSGLSPQLLESELFGHKKGAFTGASTDKKGMVEKAGDGILFLDEIGDMPLELQTMLLRFMQSGEYYRVGGVTLRQSKARIIAATNQNLVEAIGRMEFREDLYYRFDARKIELPPLRYRKADLPLLIYYFLEEWNAEDRSPVRSVSIAFLVGALHHNWRGNVRELRSYIRTSCYEAAMHSEGLEMGLEGADDMDRIPPRELDHMLKRLRLDRIFGPGDILDWFGFISQLREDAWKDPPNPGRRIWDLLLPATRSLIEEAIADADDAEVVSPFSVAGRRRSVVIEALNGLLQRDALFRLQDFSNVTLTKKARKLLENGLGDLDPADIPWLNHLLLEAAFRGKIAKARKPVPVSLQLCELPGLNIEQLLDSIFGDMEERPSTEEVHGEGCSPIPEEALETLFNRPHAELARDYARWLLKKYANPNAAGRVAKLDRKTVKSWADRDGGNSEG